MRNKRKLSGESNEGRKEGREDKSGRKMREKGEEGAEVYINERKTFKDRND